MNHKPKLRPEEKIKIVRQCLSGELGVNEASRNWGVAKISVQRWIAKYEAEGVDAFLPHEHDRVYSPTLKKAAVQEYLSGKESLLNIAKKYKISNPSQLEGWIRVYNAHGDFNSRKYSGGGSNMKQGRSTTLEERIQIVKDCIAAGKNYGEMALKYQVSYQQVRAWTLRFEKMGEAGLQDRRG